VDDAARKRFVPSTLESITYRGALYGLPLNLKVTS